MCAGWRKTKSRATMGVLAESNAPITSADENILLQTIILAADTTVVDLIQTKSAEATSDHYEILGKPANGEEAEAILRRLRDRMHRVYTGLAVFRVADEELYSEVVASDVWMRDYSDDEMQAYIASGDPLDKAGAYAIQHPVFRPVQNLQGCYANVMGLPVCHVARLLTKCGYPPVTDIAQGCQQALDFTCPVFLSILRRDDWLVE